MGHIGRGLASIGVCLLGATSMYISDGSTGVGWAVFGLFIIWMDIHD